MPSGKSPRPHTSPAFFQCSDRGLFWDEAHQDPRPSGRPGGGDELRRSGPFHQHIWAFWRNARLLTIAVPMF